MTVIAVATAQMRSWGASPDPALPEGAWICQVVATGDATGGPLIAQIDFQKANTSLSSRLFSLEQMSLVMSQNVSTFWDLHTFNLETFERLGIANRVWPLTLVQISENTGDAIPLGELAGLPLFLGSPSVQGVAAGIDFRTSNQDGPTFTAFCQGYFWGPGALTAPGGPQRPLRSMYGG